MDRASRCTGPAEALREAAEAALALGLTGPETDADTGILEFALRRPGGPAEEAACLCRLRPGPGKLRLELYRKEWAKLSQNEARSFVKAGNALLRERRLWPPTLISVPGSGPCLAQTLPYVKDMRRRASETLACMLAILLGGELEEAANLKPG